MEFRHLGRSGLRVSAIGLGCNNFGGRVPLAAAREVVDRALAAGVTLFDTADIYSGFSDDKGASEVILGQVLGPRRPDVVLATKFAKPMDAAGHRRGGSRRHIFWAVEGSLRRLRTDWIDLYQMHEPDPDTPIEETLRALDDLVRQGKVRYLGNSNFEAWRAVEADCAARSGGLSRFISCQNEYSLLARDVERELLPAMAARGLGLLPFFPLASGLLSGKYQADQPPPPGTRMAASPGLKSVYWTEQNWRKVSALREWARTRGRSLLELAFSWLLARPGVGSIIAGATRGEQVEANARAGDWKLTAEELAAVDQLLAAAES